MRLNWNLAFLFFVMLIFTIALLYCQAKFPNDGQTFQVIAGVLTAAAATFFSAARHTFNIPDEKADVSDPKPEEKKPDEQRP